MIIPVGHKAPDFMLLNHFGDPVRLAGLGGRKAILFFPTAFSTYCGNKIPGMDLIAASMKDKGIDHFLGISRESPWASSAFAAHMGLERYILLSDMDNFVARHWGTFIPSGNQRVNKRAFFLLDEQNRIRYAHDITADPAGFDLGALLMEMDRLFSGPPPAPLAWDGVIPEPEEEPLGITPAAGMGTPDFEGLNQQVKSVALSDYRGSKVLLIFFRFAFFPDCNELLLDFAKLGDSFAQRGVRMVAVSRDNPYTHRTWAKRFAIEGIDLISDMDSAIARDWGLFLGGQERGSRSMVFLLDSRGTVLWRQKIGKVRARPAAVAALSVIDDL